MGPAAVLSSAALLLVAVLAMPAPDDASREDVVYDQRQNGSTNYRVHVDGVIVAVVPADALLPLANSTGQLQQLEDLLSGAKDAADEEHGGAKKPEADKQPDKPEKGKLRLSSFLVPLLRQL